MPKNSSVTITFDIPFELRSQILHDSKVSGVRLKQSYQDIFINGWNTAKTKSIRDSISAIVEDDGRAEVGRGASVSS